VTSRLALVVIALAACSKDSGSTSARSGSGTGSAAQVVAVGSAAPKKGGFAASLSAEMAKEEGSGSASAPAAGSAEISKPADTKPVDSSKPADTKPVDSSKPVDTKPVDTSKPVDTKPGPATKPTETTKPVETATPAAPPRAPVQVSADLAAIKMDLEPNWDRDVGEAGTISFQLRVPNTSDTRLFKFHYGYDPAGAPSDRDAYMTWLGDQKLLAVTLNRQRGAAWYLEGTDGSGAAAFRYLVMYGGKHLVCWGTLYKDAASNPLGDLRDKVVMAAKKICETMTL
jgi:hypothetical protein